MSEFIEPNNEHIYWAYRTQKAAEYLEYCKDMHQKALKRLAEVAMREEQQRELDGLTEQQWLGNE